MTQRYFTPFQWIVLPILLAGLLSCKKEAQLSPTGKDINYLVVKDNLSDPLGHQLFLFYQRTGLPVFYNDTIGIQQETRPDGSSRQSYVRLSIGYAPQGTDPTIHYALLTSHQQILPLLGFLESHLVPKLPSTVFVPSLLLVDSLTQMHSTGYPLYDLNAYRGFNTLAIKVVDIDTLSDHARNEYVADMLAAVIAGKIISGDSTMQAWYQRFLSVSRSFRSLGIYRKSTVEIADGGAPRPVEDYGFITNQLILDDLQFTPSELFDLQSYISAAFAIAAADFLSLHAGQSAVLEKYGMVTTLLDQYFE